jgi:sec-independent protein translocase protein TatB
MFGLGMPEILMILAIALIVIGPKKLPDLAKTLGRAMGEFKRSAQDFKQSLDVETTVKDMTDIEGIADKKNTDDNIISVVKDDAGPKDSADTDIPGNNIDEPLKEQNSDDDLDDFLENQNSDDDKDFKSQDNSKSNDKSN